MIKIILFFGLIVFFQSGAAAAGLDIMSTSEIRSLIGPFPQPGSSEEIADDEVLQNHQRTRSEEECATAATQAHLNLREVFVQPNGPITKREFDRFQYHLLKLKVKAGLNILKAKKIYKRQRPYDRNLGLVPCIPKEDTHSYPSGHTALSRAVAQVLSSKYPQRAALLLSVARDIALNRVLGGVHHPTDIVAGEKLGDEIALRFLEDD